MWYLRSPRRGIAPRPPGRGCSRPQYLSLFSSRERTRGRGVRARRRFVRRKPAGRKEQWLDDMRWGGTNPGAHAWGRRGSRGVCCVALCGRQIVGMTDRGASGMGSSPGGRERAAAQEAGRTPDGSQGWRGVEHQDTERDETRRAGRHAGMDDRAGDGPAGGNGGHCSDIAATLEARLGPVRFARHFGRFTQLRNTGGVLEVATSSAFFAERLRRIEPAIRDAASACWCASKRRSGRRAHRG